MKRFTKWWKVFWGLSRLYDAVQANSNAITVEGNPFELFRPPNEKGDGYCE